MTDIRVVSTFLEEGRHSDDVGQTGMSLGRNVPEDRPVAGKVPLKVIPPDNRTRVTGTDEWPYCTFGKLDLVFPKGGASGSGVLVGSNVVLTAGHCAFDQKLGGWVRGARFTPGKNETAAPFGFCDALKAHSTAGWVERGNPDYDIAAFVLKENFGISVGSINIDILSDDQLKKVTLAVTGYPGDKGGLQMWTHAEKIKTVTPSKLFYEIDTESGQSGAPLWNPDTQGLAGIHTTGGSSENGAVRLNAEKSGWLKDVMSA